MNDINKDLEEAFLNQHANLSIADNDGTVKNFTTTDDGIQITKSIEIDPFLHNARLDREQYAMDNFHGKKRNTQDHVTKIASIPRLVYESIMKQCDYLGIHSQKERNAFLIEQIKSREFEAYLSVPKSAIRKSK